VVFTPANLPDLFGPLYARLRALPIGETVVLSDLAALRASLPQVLSRSAGPSGEHRFRYVEIRRGAVFPGIPASRTARLFKEMAEEEPPWFMILVPDDRQN
jgi:hypothetical protein